MKTSVRSLTGLLTIVVAVTLGYTVTRAPAATTPPNIVLVLFDDADKAAVEAMPKISGLVADHGVSFDRFYATQALCCPSRATLLTGEYVHNHRVFGNGGRNGGHQRFRDEGHEDRTIATELQELGYRTGLFGKYLNEYNETPRHVPPSWDRWFGRFGAHYYDYEVNDDGRIVRFGDSASDYATTVVRKKARAWINRQIANQSPFFAFVSMPAPHRPLVDPPKHQTEFRKAKLPAASSPSFDEANVSDKPSYIRALSRISSVEARELKSNYKHKMRMMLAVDDFVGALINDLAAADQLDNTFVIVTSDNGWMEGQHRVPKKKTVPYEESMNLPLVVRGPNVPVGATNQQLVSMADLFATFTDLAGGTEERDGRSIVPLLSGGATPWRQRLLIENRAAEQSVPRYFGVVTADHKYVQYANGEEELYDLGADPFELQSLHDSTPHSAIEAELKSGLAALSVCHGETCRTADGGP